MLNLYKMLRLTLSGRNRVRPPTFPSPPSPPPPMLSYYRVADGGFYLTSDGQKIILGAF